MSKLNSKTLSIAAVLLLVLALLVLATPLLRLSGFSSSRIITRQQNGQSFPGGGGLSATPQGQFFLPGQGTAPQGQVSPGTGTGFPNRQFGGSGGLLRLGILSGFTGTIVYAVALLISLFAAIGMFLLKRWGQVLGILMAVIYLLLALLSFIPLILVSSFTGTGIFNLSTGLDILRLVLALAVIVLALIPAKKAVLAPLPPQDAPPSTGD